MSDPGLLQGAAGGREVVASASSDACNTPVTVLVGLSNKTGRKDTWRRLEPHQTLVTPTPEKTEYCNMLTFLVLLCTHPGAPDS